MDLDTLEEIILIEDWKDQAICNKYYFAIGGHLHGLKMECANFATLRTKQWSASSMFPKSPCTGEIAYTLIKERKNIFTDVIYTIYMFVYK